jgi:O-acetyl-ADP-ribose deacetylase (regulator of RNase III)
MPNDVKRSRELEGGAALALVLGDITREEVDAIVNAANSQLSHGGGVAAAIARAGGAEVQRESDQAAPVEVGDAAVTTAGELPAEKVIHAVGPRWGEGSEEEKLRSAVARSLQLAGEHGLESVSLPAISTGIFGYPLEQAAPLILRTIEETVARGEASSLREVRLCLFDEETLAAFQEAWTDLWE